MKQLFLQATGFLAALLNRKFSSGAQTGERMIAMSTTPNLAPVKPSLDKLQALERELIAYLIERDEVIRASLVALLSRQHLVVLGPPGTGKSALVTSLAERISPQNGAGLWNFSYLMTRFTTPEELFGPVSVSGLKHDEYKRITSGKLVEAELVFLDLLRSKQQPDGAWLLENTHPGKVHFPLEDGDNRPSRWNMLRALRVLNLYEQSAA
jgi:MoxR domain in the MoxR-vWA-beta-propeller ternary systems